MQKLFFSCLLVVMMSACSSNTDENPKNSVSQDQNPVSQNGNPKINQVKNPATDPLKDFTHDEATFLPSITSEKFINPPIPDLDIPYQNFTVQTKQNSILRYQKTGSTIVIPENIFIDAKGDLVDEEITITYRELHTASEVILSGIPMVYDSAGVSYNFETAGMFEIRGAKKDGTPVFILPKKSIEVSMVSYNEDTEFNFYNLNEKAKKWEFLNASNETKIKHHKQSRINNELQLQNYLSSYQKGTSSPVLPSTLNPNLPVWNFEFPVHKHHYNKVLAGCVWQAYADSNATQIHELSGASWDKIDFSQHNNEAFKITLQRGKEKVITYGKPVFMGKLYDDALAKFMQEVSKFEAAKKEREERNALAKETNLLAAEFTNGLMAANTRKANVQSFGIFNYDRFTKIPKRYPIAANFIFEPKPNNKIHLVFLIVGKKNNTIVRFDYANWGNFAFVPDEETKLVALMSNNKVAVMSNKDFDALHRTKVFKLNQPNTHTFMLSQAKSYQSPEELNTIINNL